MDIASDTKTDSSPKPVVATANTAGKGDDSFDISEAKKFSLGMLICWLVVIMAIAGSIFFWLLNNSAKQAIKTKTDEKQQIINEISSPTLSDIELKATAFKSAVNQLSLVSKARYSMDDFLTKFYLKIAQNVKLTNVAVASDGSMSMSGTTVAYRAVADQMMLLKDWKVNDANIFTTVKLSSVADVLDEKTGKATVTFLITGTVDKTQTLVEKPIPSASTSSATDPTSTILDTTSTSDITAGGSDASIQ